MKRILTLLLLAVFTLTLSTSCGSDKPKAKEKTTADINAAKNKKPKTPINVASKDYYTNLQETLKLRKRHIRSLKAIDAKYVQKMRQTRRANGKLTKADRKNFNDQKNTEIKELLGAKLYRKKINFDKKQKQLKKAQQK